MPIATSKVTNRRKVQYTSLQDVLSDAERLTRGNFNTLGNWSAGQIFMHRAHRSRVLSELQVRRTGLAKSRPMTRFAIFVPTVSCSH